MYLGQTSKAPKFIDAGPVTEAPFQPALLQGSPLQIGNQHGQFLEATFLL